MRIVECGMRNNSEIRNLKSEMEKIMLKNYLKIMIRSVINQKAFSLINILGLAIGMASAIVVFLLICYELSFDAYHEHAGRIYRLLGGGAQEGSAYSQAVLAPALRQAFPEVLATARFAPCRPAPLISYQDRHFYEPRFYWADSTVFDVFTFPLIKGNPKTALTEPYSVLLTEDVAHKYFGDEDPLGKIVTFRTEETTRDYLVTGILKNIPARSHFKFDFLASLASELQGRKHWYYRVYTYILLPENYPPARFEQKIPQFAENFRDRPNLYRRVKKARLQPLTQIHLHSALYKELEENESISYIFLFSCIGILILLIACINYMNLSTAQSLKRAREVGVRKVFGANRAQIIRHYLGEALGLSFLAVFIATGIVELVLPLFNRLAEKQLAMDFDDAGFLFAGLLGTATVAGIVSGSYPAFFLSRFNPVEIFRATTATRSHGALFRKGLVVFQFAVSVALMLVTGIILGQLHYMKSTSLGFSGEQVLVMKRSQLPRHKYSAFKNELLKHPGIVSVAASSAVPGIHTPSTVYGTKTGGIDSTFLCYEFAVDHDFITTLEIQLDKGRVFEKDRDNEMAFLVNEEFVKRYAWDNPVGQPLVNYNSYLNTITGEAISYELPGKIIGVVKDFHLHSLHRAIEPVVIRPDFSWYSSRAATFFGENVPYILVRIHPKQTQEIIEVVRQHLRTFAPDSPVEISFLSQDFEMLYAEERKLAQIYSGFSLLAIFIACLGLFGLAAFAAERRTKEIGIRKVLGATVANVTALLSKDFVKLVLLANLIAWPAAWYAMNKWLQNFAYRIEIGWWVFALAGGLALVIALLTVSAQAIHAALANPVESLRYE
jgi:putative ABC transport system permease protein